MDLLPKSVSVRSTATGITAVAVVPGPTIISMGAVETAGAVAVAAGPEGTPVALTVLHRLSHFSSRNGQ